MKNLLSVLLGLIITTSVFAQLPIRHYPLGQDKQVDAATFKAIKKSSTSGSQIGTRGTNIGFDLDYDAADEIASTNMGGVYQRFIWNTNQSYGVSLNPVDTADNFTVKWGAVVFDTLFDYQTNQSYPWNLPDSIIIDTVFVAFTHENTSGQVDSIVIRVVEKGGSPSGLLSSNQGVTLTNVPIWDTTLTTTTTLTGATTLGVLAIPTNILVPQGKQFVVIVNYYGPKADIFNLLGGYNDMCNDDCAGEPSVIDDNSWYYFNYGIPPSLIIQGINPVFLDCDGSGSLTPGACEEFYIQNWAIWCSVRLIDVPLYANATATSTSICPGDAVQLNANVAGGTPPLNVTWSPMTGLTSPFTSQTGANPTTTTTYTATVIDADNDTVISSITINVNGITVDIGSNQVIDCGTTVDLFATVGGTTSGATFVWNNGVNSINNNNLSAGTYSITVNNTFGCTATDQVVISFPTNQAVDFDWGGKVCLNVPRKFTNLSNNKNGWAWSWDFGDGNLSNQEDAINTYTTAGNYNVKLTADSASCSIERTRSITVIVSTDDDCDNTVGIENLAFANASIQLFPNPSRGLVHLTVDGGNLKGLVMVNVYDLTGKNVFSAEYNEASIRNTTMDLSHLNNGIYMVQIGNGEASVNRKITINK